MTPEEEAMFKDMGNDIQDLKHNIIRLSKEIQEVYAYYGCKE